MLSTDVPSAKITVAAAVSKKKKKQQTKIITKAKDMVLTWRLRSSALSRDRTVREDLPIPGGCTAELAFP